MRLMLQHPLLHASPCPPGRPINSTPAVELCVMLCGACHSLLCIVPHLSCPHAGRHHVAGAVCSRHRHLPGCGGLPLDPAAGEQAAQLPGVLHR